MVHEDRRFDQRLENFNKVFALLEKAIAIPTPSETEKGGIIQFFEVAFELSWKVMQDYLGEQGYIVKSPRAAIKRAFQIDIIDCGEEWLNALEQRNLTAHTYDEKMADAAVEKIRSAYFPLLRQFHCAIQQRELE